LPAGPEVLLLRDRRLPPPDAPGLPLLLSGTAYGEFARLLPLPRLKLPHKPRRTPRKLLVNVPSNKRKPKLNVPHARLLNARSSALRRKRLIKRKQNGNWKTTPRQMSLPLPFIMMMHLQPRPPRLQVHAAVCSKSLLLMMKKDLNQACFHPLTSDRATRKRCKFCARARLLLRVTAIHSPTMILA